MGFGRQKRGVGSVMYGLFYGRRHRISGVGTVSFATAGHTKALRGIEVDDVLQEEHLMAND